MDEKNLESQNPTDSSVFPGFTEWKSINLCCFHFYTIPKLHQTYCGHWEVKPFFPLLFALLSLSSLFVVTIFALPYFGLEGRLITVLIIILFLLFNISYIRIITDGPGYFPFYWGTPFKPTDKSNNIASALLLTENNPDDDDAPFGIISSHEQLEWVEGVSKRPPRSIFSESARRFVIRPEHYCKWASSWIGKRNHKFFMLFSLYGILYLGLFVVYLARRLVQCFNDTFSLSMILLTIYGVGAAAFFLMFVSFFASNLIDLALNRTSWEQWNGVSWTDFDRGTKSANAEDALGKRSPLWICPCSPWKGLSNEELATSYRPYRFRADENIQFCFE